MTNLCNDKGERKQAFLLGNGRAQNKTISLYIITTRLGTLTGLVRQDSWCDVRHKHFHLSSAADSDFEGRYYKSL